jgi:hypothetical protein
MSCTNKHTTASNKKYVAKKKPKKKVKAKTYTAKKK